MPTKISIEKNDDNHLRVSIKTKHLRMESTTLYHFSDYTKLFKNPKNMASFADGQTRAPQTVKLNIDEWVKRWHTNNPFSSLVISEKGARTVVGYVVLGYGEKPGSAEVAYMIDEKFWNRGYGKEAVIPVVTEYVPELFNKGYNKINQKDFTSVDAVVRTDNEFSIKILKHCGMQQDPQVENKYGHDRYRFFVSTEKLKQQYLDKGASTVTLKEDLMDHDKGLTTNFGNK